ncbi:MAG: PDZ domain-containing protein, partial [Phycisphaerae bacterium]|nr:PDZ domain-containing protein [Phycisphaerae bacterium]
MPKRNIVWILAILAAAAVTLWVTRKDPPLTGPQRQQFDPVIWTYRHIQDNYYRRVAESDLRRGAVRGMVEALDEFSSYVEPDQAEMIERRAMGRRRGMGLRVKMVNGRVQVIGPLFGSPAHRAGIFAPQRILAIDDVDLGNLTLAQVNDLLSGPVGTDVQLLIETPDAETRSVKLARSEFPLETVQGLSRDAKGRWIWMIEKTGRIAYVRIKEFVPDTGQFFQRAVRALEAPGGLVLDLRDNPGGLLPAAIEVANLFLRQGEIVTITSRGGKGQTYTASAEGTFPQTLRVVVLINAKTASAAEIVAGALSQRGRAVLVGTRSRGKGCVQTIYHLPGKLGSVNLTTSEYVLADGQRITRTPGSDTWGIDPHVQVTHLPHLQEKLRELW